ncbi:MAG: hypothetical protein U5K29_00450 [Acidimicrobiales bacterium]|nr:hypothetical protein [Acidimicrobiales bacterium]
MPGERYVVLGLARPRAHWFAEITRWATTAALPVEFVKCLTVEETRSRLSSGRRWSALLVDGKVPGADRDLIDRAREVGAAVLVIDDPRVDRSWSVLGATAVLPSQLQRDDLLAALAEHAKPVARSTPRPEPSPTVATSPWRGKLVAVTGPGGTGASTVAAMLAQGVGSEVTEHGLVVLADLALDADQAVIHDAGDVMPGLPELIDAHRLGRPEPDEVRNLTFDTDPRSYHLLLGLRHHRDWTALRPRAVAAAIDGLRRSYRMVIADVDHDLEGERDTGSTDIEERNMLARHCATEADALVVVGAPGPVGVHRLARLIRRLVSSGVSPQRLLPVINRGPRSRRQRAEIAAAIADLTGSQCRDVASPITLADRRHLDEIIRAGSRWPDPLARSLRSAVQATLERAVDASDAPVGPERIAPGSLGHFTDPNEIEEDLA